MAETKRPRDVGASVRARLLTLARQKGQAFDLLLTCGRRQSAGSARSAAAQIARLCPRDRGCGPGRIPDAARTARTPAIVGRFEVVNLHAQVNGSEGNGMDPQRGVQPMKRPFSPNFGAVRHMPQLALQAQ